MLIIYDKLNQAGITIALPANYYYKPFLKYKSKVHTGFKIWKE
jgi:hypothetical protein